jgi:hypothetical protein
MAALVISMGVLAYGYDSAFIGTTITHQSFKRDFGLLPSQKTKAEINEVTSNITSICKFLFLKNDHILTTKLRLCRRSCGRLAHVPGS